LRVDPHDERARGEARGDEERAPHARLEAGAEAEERAGVARVAQVEEAVDHRHDPAAAQVRVGELLRDLVERDSDGDHRAEQAPAPRALAHGWSWPACGSAAAGSADPDAGTSSRVKKGQPASRVASI